MGNKETELIETACRHLSTILGSTQTLICREGQGGFDCILSFEGMCFGVVCKRLLFTAGLPSILQLASQAKETNGMPVLIMLGYAQNSVLKTLIENGICYIDYAGNCWIKQDRLFLSVSGNKNTFRDDTKTRILSDAAIRLIFHFLSDENLISEGYRSISAKTGYSLGTIKNTIEELNNNNFILNTDKGRKLIRKNELLPMWATAYNQVSRHKMILHRMKFRSDDFRKDWKSMKLPQGMVWGGDCGANLTDGYLIPGSYEIYTSLPSTQLMTTGMVMPDDNGEITLYQKFWNGDSDVMVAPKIVLYADLLNGGDSRQADAAQRLISNGIYDKQNNTGE